MKVLMINGSPRKDGNTARALKEIAFPAPVTTRYLRLIAVPFPGETPDWSAPGAKVEFAAP